MPSIASCGTRTNWGIRTRMASWVFWEAVPPRGSSRWGSSRWRCWSGVRHARMLAPSSRRRAHRSSRATGPTPRSGSGCSSIRRAAFGSDRSSRRRGCTWARRSCSRARRTTRRTSSRSSSSTTRPSSPIPSASRARRSTRSSTCARRCSSRSGMRSRPRRGSPRRRRPARSPSARRSACGSRR